MGYLRSASLLVILSLAIAAPGDAATARVTLASGASRTCTGETKVRIVRNLLEPASNGQEQSTSMNETLSVRLVGDQYEVRRSYSIPGGQAVHTAHLRPDGTVIDATMSGSMPMIGGSDELQRVSILAARMLPESLALGRDFHPGENLYANVDTQDLVSSLVGAMGLPPGFEFQMTGTLPFTGVTGDGASRSLNFAGILQGTGAGQANGQMMTLIFPSRATVTIDAATGLMRSSTGEGTMEIKIDGVTQLEMHLIQTMACTISSAA